MATVYIKPGTGSGSGTLAAPYFFNELGTAETAAGNDGKILFTDGDYVPSGTTFNNGNSIVTLTYESLNPHGARLVPTSALTLQLGWGDAPATSSTTILRNFYTQNCSWRGYLDGSRFELHGLKQIDTVNSHSSGTAGLFYGRSNTLAHVVKGCSFFVKFGASGGFFNQLNASTISETTIFVVCDGTSDNGIGQFSNGTNTSGGEPTLKNVIIKVDTANKLNANAITMTKVTFSCLVETQQTVSGNNNISSDPLFVDEANADLRLRPGSPCINAGTAS